jgi:signal transduction histidine kinase
MTEFIFKYFAIIIGCFYIYDKLLNQPITIKQIAIDLTLCMFISVFSYYIRLYIPPLTIPIMVVFSVVFLALSTKTKLELSITTTILSYGISYAFFDILIISFAMIYQVFGVANSTKNVCIIILCECLTQILLTNVLFRFKRLKSGMPFLKNKGYNYTGVFISVLLLCSVMILTRDNNSELVYIIPVALIFFCGIFILFWWRGKLAKTYIERLRADELRSLKDAIRNRDMQIENLRQQNDALAKIIHKDNKLIPAMELAVEDYLGVYEENSIKAKEKGRELITQLEKMFGERSDIIREYQADNGKLPLTNVLSIDSLMKYMFNRAKENGVVLEFILSGSVKYMIENIILDSDLRTLLADLIENAIISTKKAINKRILVSIGISDCHYLINVLDSGIPFEEKTIVDLGLNKATTHAEEGGSGIGLLTVFQIIKAHLASFIIEEFPDNSIYTKKLSVKFDCLDQYIVKTTRYNEIRSISRREDLVVLKG